MDKAAMMPPTDPMPALYLFKLLYVGSFFFIPLSIPSLCIKNSCLMSSVDPLGQLLWLMKCKQLFRMNPNLQIFMSQICFKKQKPDIIVMLPKGLTTRCELE